MRDKEIHTIVTIHESINEHKEDSWLIAKEISWKSLETDES